MPASLFLKIAKVPGHPGYAQQANGYGISMRKGHGHFDPQEDFLKREFG
jgi:hypothetical protein